MSEWYPENLESLIRVIEAVPDLADIDGVFEIEVRVRVDDQTTWAVIGYGESGDPCVLRFEETPKIEPPKNNVFTINHPTPSWGNSGGVHLTPLASTPPFSDNVWNDGHTNKM